MMTILQLVVHWESSFGLIFVFIDFACFEFLADRYLAIQGNEYFCVSWFPLAPGIMAKSLHAHWLVC
jgi:hypothetical protein